MNLSSLSLPLTKTTLPPSLPFSSSRSSLFPTSSRTISLFSGRLGTQTRARHAKKGLTCNALFGLGVPELVVIAGVAALVFGPKKLPEVGRSIGKTVRSFQEAAKEFESELKKEPDSSTQPDLEKPTTVSSDEKKEVAGSKESV